jgi:hypothetical protein
MDQPCRVYGIVLLSVIAIIALLAGISGHLIVLKYQDAQIQTARAKAKDLAERVEIYQANGGSYPQSFEAMAVPQPCSGAQLFTPESVIDPWGQIFQLRIDKDEKGNDRIEVFTFAPATGERISNLARTAELPAGPLDHTAMVVTLALIAALGVVTWAFRERGARWSNRTAR